LIYLYYNRIHSTDDQYQYSFLRSIASHLLTSAHNFVDKEKLLGKNRCQVQELSLHHVIIPDIIGGTAVSGLASEHIQTEVLLLVLMLVVLFLNLQKSVLSIITGVGGQSSRNDKKGISEGLDTELGLTRDVLLGVLLEVLSGSDLEGTTTGDDGLVLKGVLDSSKTISDSILGLSNGVIIGSLDQDSAREWVLNTFNESVFVLTEGLLVDELGETKILLLDIVEGVEADTTAGERDSLTVSSLCSSNTDDTVSGEQFKGRRVNTLLVDDNEVLVGTLAELLLQIADLLNLLIGESALRGDKLLSLVSVGPEETGVDLGLFVFEGNIEAHDVAVLKAGRHVRVATTVIENETLDELGLSAHLVLHVHDFDHMEINGLVGTLNSLDSIDQDFGEWVSEVGMNLGVEGRGGNFNEKVTLDFALNVLLEFFKELESLNLGKFKTIDNDSGVDTVTEISFGLAHNLTNEKNVGGGTITSDIILSSGSTSNHSGSRVLDLHLMEQDATILGQFNLSRASNEHLNGTLRTEVGLKNFLKTFSGVNVDSKGSGLSDDVGLRVNHLQRTHSVF